MADNETALVEREIEIPLDSTEIIRGTLDIAKQSKGIIIFAHGSASNRLSPRNKYVASELQEKGFATLLFDLLTDREEEIDLQTREFRFDIGLLAKRLILATRWCGENKEIKRLPVGYFGASTGAAAALFAAADLGDTIKAVVSRGGRADLAISVLPSVTAPTLLIVGGDDSVVIDMNRRAAKYLKAKNALLIIPGAGHLFEEPGALAQVSNVTAEWFENHLTK
jgi:alpha-beta hydrolase superfamily lysophospholipase